MRRRSDRDIHPRPAAGPSLELQAVSNADIRAEVRTTPMNVYRRCSILGFVQPGPSVHLTGRHHRVHR
jgi:hypothetical protein